MLFLCKNKNISFIFHNRTIYPFIICTSFLEDRKLPGNGWQSIIRPHTDNNTCYKLSSGTILDCTFWVGEFQRKPKHAQKNHGILMESISMRLSLLRDDNTTHHTAMQDHEIHQTALKPTNFFISISLLKRPIYMHLWQKSCVLCCHLKRFYPKFLCHDCDFIHRSLCEMWQSTNMLM